MKILHRTLLQFFLWLSKKYILHILYKICSLSTENQWCMKRAIYNRIKKKKSKYQTQWNTTQNRIHFSSQFLTQRAFLISDGKAHFGLRPRLHRSKRSLKLPSFSISLFLFLAWPTESIALWEQRRYSLAARGRIRARRGISLLIARYSSTTFQSSSSRLVFAIRRPESDGRGASGRGPGRPRLSRSARRAI